MTTRERFEALALWVETHELEGVTLLAHEVRWMWAWPSAAHEAVYHSDGRLEGVPSVLRWDECENDCWERVFGRVELKQPWRRLARFEQLRSALSRRPGTGVFLAAKVVGWYPNPDDRTRFVAFQSHGAIRGSRRFSRWDTLPTEDWNLVLAAAAR